MEFSGAVKILGFAGFGLLKSHAGGYHVSHACTSKSAGKDAYKLM
jgi:hypothetical protein